MVSLMFAKWKLCTVFLLFFAGTFLMMLLQETEKNNVRPADPHFLSMPVIQDSRDSYYGTSSILDDLRKTLDTGKKLSHYLATLNREKMMKVINEFHLNGTEHFSIDTAHRFLVCHLLPEERSRHVDKVQLDNVCMRNKAFRKTGKLIGLASFPGSGNTWTRTLLEQSTGIYTGSIYSDNSLVNAGFEGECLVSRNVIAIKTHGTYNPGLKERISVKFDGVIYIVRNLYDALVSEHTRRTTKSHISALPASAFGK